MKRYPKQSSHEHDEQEDLPSDSHSREQYSYPTSYTAQRMRPVEDDVIREKPQEEDEETESRYSKREAPERPYPIKTSSSEFQQPQMNTQPMHSREEIAEYYFQKFSGKIREQAEKLQELENYKVLAERRILDLCPNHPLPIQDFHLGKPIPKSPTSDQQVTKLTHENQDLKQMVSAKEQELRYFSSQIEKIKLENSQLKLMTTKKMGSYTNRDNFPPMGKFESMEELGNAYTHLLTKLNTIEEEKLQLEKSLRAETLANEEQRNYIEILREAIEAKVEDSGLITILKEADEVDKVDLYTNLSNLKRSTDQYRVHNVKMASEQKDMEGHIKELREQLLDQKKYNNELNNVRIRTTEELQATLRNLKKASENIQKLESEKNALLDYIEESVAKQDHLQSEIDSKNDQTSHLEDSMERVVKEKESQDSENREIGELENLILEAKRKNNNLANDFLSLEKEYNGLKNKLADTNTNLNDNLKRLESANSEIDKIQDKNQEYLLEIKQRDTITDNLNKEIKQKREEAIGKQEDHNYEIKDLKSKNRATEDLLEQQRDSTKRKEELFVKELNQLESTHEDEKRIINDSINILKSEERNLNVRINKLKSSNEEYMNMNVNLNNENSKLAKNFDEIEKDMQILIKDYDKVKDLNKQLNQMLKNSEYQIANLETEEVKIRKLLEERKNEFESLVEAKNFEKKNNEAQKSRIEEDLEEKNQETLKLKNNIRNHEDKIYELERDCDKKQKRLIVAGEEAEELRKSKEKQKKVLEDEIERRNSEIEDKRLEIVTYRELANKYEDKLDENEKAIEKLKRAIEDLKNDITAITNEKEKDQILFNDKLKTANNEVTFLSNEIKSYNFLLDKEREQCQKELQEIKDNYRHENATLKGELLSTQQLHDNELQSIDTLREELSEKNGELNLEKKRTQNLETKYNEVQEQIRQITNKISEEQMKSRENESEKLQLASRFEKKESQILLLERELELANIHKNDLAQDLTSSTAKIDLIQKDLNDYQRYNTELENNMRTQLLMNEESETMMRENRLMHSELTSFRERARVEKMEKVKINEKLDIIEQKLENENKELSKENQKLRNEQQNIQFDIDKLTMEKERLFKNCDEWRRNSEANSALVKLLEEKISILTNEKKDYEILLRKIHASSPSAELQKLIGELTRTQRDLHMAIRDKQRTEEKIKASYAGLNSLARGTGENASPKQLSLEYEITHYEKQGQTIQSQIHTFQDTLSKLTMDLKELEIKEKSEKFGKYARDVHKPSGSALEDELKSLAVHKNYLDTSITARDKEKKSSPYYRSSFAPIDPSPSKRSIINNKELKLKGDFGRSSRNRDEGEKISILEELDRVNDPNIDFYPYYSSRRSKPQDSSK